jgi:hypothetical protein
MTHQETVALNNLNAAMNDIADMLAIAYEKFNGAYYEALEALGHSERMHDLNLSFQNFVNELADTKLNEADFPDCNDEAYDDCEDLKQSDDEADKNDNASYSDEI